MVQGAQTRSMNKCRRRLLAVLRSKHPGTVETITPVRSEFTSPNTATFSRGTWHQDVSPEATDEGMNRQAYNEGYDQGDSDWDSGESNRPGTEEPWKRDGYEDGYRGSSRKDSGFDKPAPRG